MLGYEMPSDRGLDVNTQYDLDVARFLANKKDMLDYYSLIEGDKDE
jgi:hypothetical protein